MPPAEYPAPLTSPVDEYTVVEALMVAESKYKAALKVSAVEAARIGAVPKLCVAVNNSPMKEVHIDWVFAMIYPLSKRSCFAATKDGDFFQGYMGRAVDKFSIQPVFHPCGEFVVIIDCTFPLFKQGLVHVAFGCGYKCHYAILMSADVLVLAGIATVNVEVEVLSLPKSKTQTAPLSPAL
jgi:hypothetical protein